MNEQLNNIEPTGGEDVEPPARMNPLAVAGFATSFFCGPAGIVMSIIAYKQIARDIGSQRGWGFAKAGIGVGIGMGFFQIFYLIVFLSSL